MVASQANPANEALDQSVKKYSYLGCGAPHYQISNTPATDINAIAIKNDKKVEVNLSQIKYNNCHKQGYYTNKCLDKEP